MLAPTNSEVLIGRSACVDPLIWIKERESAALGDLAMQLAEQVDQIALFFRQLRLRARRLSK